MRRFSVAAAAALLVGLASAPLAAFAQGITCNSTVHCPTTAPCCSEYGFCGTGQFCLGGCQPFSSNQPTSCKPNPVCKSYTTDFNDLSRVLLNATQYNGNASKWDWVLEKGTLVADPNGNGQRLTLTQSGGTLLSSTRYIHYGQIDFTMQASKWAGVVSAAITMSDVKDEIDIEFASTPTNQVQSNYFFLGVVNYTDNKGATHNFSGNTFTEMNTYTLNWQQDQLQWAVNGKVLRTVTKASTLSLDGTQYKYPSTPSRIQISIWPAGLPTSAKGTIEWAGGLIDWNDPDYVANGYFWNTFKSVSISCADEGVDNTDSTVLPDTVGYSYTGNDTSDTPMVTTTNHSTVLGSGAPGALSASISLIGMTAAAAIIPALTWSLF
ncbi:putative glycosidase crf2 [Vanrija pseudolonga]|uniref:Glycosidase crf2 n=1 Tax=Vanrija pseudolonga TaxID=143232 RepID=A0AAF0YJ95_9TREE|nr:putative glycosidase crf2 [Vanrija pseudolonga]